MQCFISLIYCHYYSFIGIPLYSRTINQCVSDSSFTCMKWLFSHTNNKQTEKATNLFRTPLKPFNVYSESIPNTAGKRIKTE